MPEGLYIERHRRSDGDEPFAELRRLGIELAQQFSGKLWTDFNLHDPGVTILEQLAYAITELIYRTDLPVEDLLSADTGIDYRRQALYAPEQIFPCRPATLLDYRKLLLDRISELDNCWLQPVTGAEGGRLGKGLYRILLKPDQTIAPSEYPSVLKKVRECYSRQRNLGEDVAEITFMRELDYALCARVEVTSDRRPADILAEIYFKSARRVSGRVAIEDYARTAQGEQALDQVFNGPYTDKGMLLIEDRLDQHEAFVVSMLYPVINGVEGVDRVESLYLERDGQAYYDTIACDQADASLQLRMPRTADEVRVVLTLNARVIPIAYDELLARYEELRVSYYASRSTPQDLSLLYELPAGTQRGLDQYYSIQHQFPINYGIGSYGIPDSAPAQVKARARQLKSYLMLFEQMMANYLANLDGIKGLYSIDKAPRHSYGYEPLDEQHIAGVRDFYPDPDDKQSWRKALGAILSEFDHYHERKSRLLDYMLALYGESFSQNSLRHYDCYYRTAEEMAEKIIDNKIDYLQSVVELGRDKTKAGDYRADSWPDRATTGLHQRVGRLLGFRQIQAGSLTKGVLNEGIKLARHSTYEYLKRGSDELSFIDSEGGELLPVTGWEKAKELSARELREIIGDSIPLKNSLLSDMLLREGVDIDRFRLFRPSRAGMVQLGFRTVEGPYWHLGDYADCERGMQAASALQRLLIHLNLECEGFHLIEHILLRPLGDDRHEGLELPPEGDFYAHRISLIFPLWTARCHEPDFRLLAEETVRLNLPAHIYAECYWLGFHEMYEWEAIYVNWLDLKSRDQVHQSVLDRASARLLRYLLNLRTSKQRE